MAGAPIDDEAAEVVVTASRAFVGLAIRSLAESGVDVTLPQHRLLVLLASGGPQSVGRLAEGLGIDQSNASRMCDRLQRLGLLERERSDADRRSVTITLTRQGERLLDTVSAHRREDVRRILGEMSADDVECMVRGLAAFSVAAHEAPGSAWSVPIA